MEQCDWEFYFISIFPMNFGYEEQAIYDSFITLETLFSENPMRSLLAKRSIDKTSTWQCMITLCM